MRYAKNWQICHFFTANEKQKQNIHIHILLRHIQPPYLYHSIFWMNPIYYAKDIKQTIAKENGAYFATKHIF